MKAIINNEELSAALKKMSTVVRKNNVVPITGCALFEFTKNKLTITGTDLETILVTTLPCVCKDEFSVPITYTDILDIASSVREPIEISVEGTVINFVSGKSKFKLPTVGKQEHFPPMPEEIFSLDVNVDGDFYYSLIGADSFKSIEAMKANFNMACIDIRKDKLCVVGTDASKLYKKTIPQTNKKELRVMVPGSFANLCKNFQHSTISIGDRFIKSEFGNDTVISRLSDNKFPDYDVVIPTDREYNFSCNRIELNNAIKSVIVSSNKTTKSGVLSFTKGQVKISSSDVDLGKEGEVYLDVDHSVEIEAIQLNLSFLSFILSQMDAEIVDLSILEFDKAILLKPSTEENLLCLLMPLKF